MITLVASKKPIIAAILNIIYPGAGYLYAGVRKEFAWLLSIGIALVITASFDPLSAGYMEGDTPVALMDSVATLLILTAFGYDAYSEAKSIRT